ncbi:hypothetical protein EDF18_0979 [Frigoribacterium sp. PhB107]|uniref:hypothetical protein n=1 Tax=Frigoribacterium sp. PhB107 TaxID=2485172 RepID=UPI000F484985|nr:hypothetical protein [Frigoribacterium sp. PhB107]ROP78333.1 hypothetical protein EDF18_0979 [Frigoribacterium sp. PhB107]
MTRILIGDLRTGRKLQDVSVLSATWAKQLNAAGTISITVTLRDPDLVRLGLRNVATPGKSFLAVVENDVVMEAGPIWTHDYDRDAGTLKLTAAGLWSYFDHRVLIPVLAAGQSPVGADTNLSGLWLGTIAKRIVQQARAHTGGNVPVVFQADEAGTSERKYLGADLALVGDRLEDITNVIGGPDIDFAPRFTADRLGIEWVMRVGTAAQPQLSSTRTHVWDLAVPEPSVRGLQVKRTAERMVGRAWATGGRTDDVVMTARYENPTLTAAGYPLLEAVDSSHSSVSVQSTLDGYAAEAARTGYKPIEFWSFEVDATATPRVGTYQVGDYSRTKIKGDPYVPDNVTDGYLRRIVAMSGDEQGRWIKVTTGEVYSLDA